MRLETRAKRIKSATGRYSRIEESISERDSYSALDHDDSIVNMRYINQLVE